MKRNLMLVISTGLLISACISCTGSKTPSEPSKPSEPSSAAESVSTISSEESIPSAPSSTVSSDSQEISSDSSVSSQDSSSSSQGDEKTRSFNINYTSVINSENQYVFPFTYDPAMFESDSSTFNSDIAMFAFGSTLANQNADNIKKFYTDAGFDDVYLSETYTKGHTDKSIGYAIAHKKESDFDVISVSIKGFEYQREWADNFNLGLEGEHAGFAARADEVNIFLKAYVNLKGYEKENVKLLIAGYSRGAAVANLLGKRVNDDKAVANLNNIYVYTLEAPKCSLSRGEYTNIYNIVNSADAITYFPPTEYGFTRYGQDIDIYDANIDALLTAHDERLTLPAFEVEDENVTDDPSFARYILNTIVTYEEYDEGQKQVQTREEFVNNYEDALQYVINLFFSLKPETLEAMKTEVSNKSVWQLLGLLATDGLYEFCKPYLDEDGIEYEDEALRANTNNATRFLTGPAAAVLLLAANKNVLTRLIAMHTPEVDYVLLLNYINNLQVAIEVE